MTKQKVTQRFAATLERKGKTVTVEACCGPAVLRLTGRLVGYRPLSDERPGACCHV